MRTQGRWSWPMGQMGGRYNSSEPNKDDYVSMHSQLANTNIRRGCIRSPSSTWAGNRRPSNAHSATIQTLGVELCWVGRARSAIVIKQPKSSTSRAKAREESPLGAKSARKLTLVSVGSETCQRLDSMPETITELIARNCSGPQMIIWPLHAEELITPYQMALDEVSVRAPRTDADPSSY